MPVHDAARLLKLKSRRAALSRKGLGLHVHRAWRENSPHDLLPNAKDLSEVAENALGAHTKRTAENCPGSEHLPSVLALNRPLVRAGQYWIAKLQLRAQTSL